MNKFTRYYMLCALGCALACAYPVYMAVSVARDMIVFGSVPAANYPKYIIPYAPMGFALLVSVAVMPLMFKYARKRAFLGASALSASVFFVSELLLESKVIVTETVHTTLESWQLFMCYVQPDQYETRTWRAVDVLIGEYSPAFKLHFYVIALLILLAILNCVYGYAHMIRTGDKRRRSALNLQAASAALFLALSIFACFTAFYRTGELTVLAISAILMCLFFITFGVTAGVFVGSLLTGAVKRRALTVSALVAMTTTLIMYIGELILLSGNLYRFGSGFLFEGLGAAVLAPIDIIVIISSGGITALALALTQWRSKAREQG